ncbi:uncharacterized protein Dvar_48410 [Desulfosarcina variabilis str. Montpellier]
MARILRDTRVSLGISKIWSPRQMGVLYKRGALVESEPEEGIGYDLIFNRRLWGDIVLRMDFYYYDFDNYVVWAHSETDYAQEGDWSQRPRNLDNVEKKGVEVNLSGTIWRAFSFNVGYVYQDWDYDGPYPSAIEELSDRAKHRVNAGLRYRIFKNTLFMVDYSYQSEQTAYINEEDPPLSGDFIAYENDMDSFNVFDMAIEQILIRKSTYFHDLKLKVYSKNVFDEEYEDERGYPMTDVTFGCSISCSF